MRRPAATVLFALVALTAACGSSSKQAAPPTTETTPTLPVATEATTTVAPTTTRARPTTTQTTTRARTTATTTAAPPPAATTTTTATTLTVTAPEVGQTVCPSEQSPGIDANFGHRRTTASANALVARAGAVGFKGLTVQRRGCNDYAVVLVGLKTLREARDFRREARSVGYPVRIECRSHPVLGGLAAVFGHRRTRRDAVKLKRQAQAVGFRNLQVQEDRCSDWEVDLYGIQSPSQRQDLAKEAARVGFHITFEPG